MPHWVWHILLMLLFPINQFSFHRLGKEKRDMIDIGKTGVKTVIKNVQETKSSKIVQSNPERDKRMIARAKERRATLILGM